MKRSAWLSLILVPAVVLLAACTSPFVKPRVAVPPRTPASAAAPTSAVQVVAAPQPAVNPRQVKQDRRAVEVKMDRLEQVTAEQKKLQTRLNNELYNLQRQLVAVQAQVQQVEGRATETAKKIADGETALANLKNDMDRLGGHLPAAAADPKLAEQKRQLEAQQTVLEQREAEIRDLRSALGARDAVMKEQMRGAIARPAPAAAATADVPSSVPRPAPVDSSMSIAQRVAEGNRLLRTGKPNDAEAMFSSALMMDPFLVDARFGLASCRYARGALEEAKKLVDAVIKADPRNAGALGLAGIIAWKQNDLKLATTMLERAIKQDPKDAQLHNYLGIIRYAQGKRSHAISELEKAVALDPDLAEANFNLAVILATDNRPKLDEARQYYQASLRLGNTRDEKLEGILYQ
jgi:tetratricopeptide (TPR) repeat protein